MPNLVTILVFSLQLKFDSIICSSIPTPHLQRPMYQVLRNTYRAELTTHGLTDEANKSARAKIPSKSRPAEKLILNANCLVYSSFVVIMHFR